MSRAIVGFVFLIYLLALVSCDTVKNDLRDGPKVENLKVNDSDLSKLEINRLKWQNAGINDYSFDISASGFLIPFLPAVIEVRDSKMVSVKPLEPSKNVHWVDSYTKVKISTIEQLFEFVEEEYDRQPHKFEIIYDDKYGYPNSINLTRKERNSEADFAIAVSNFKILE